MKIIKIAIILILVSLSGFAGHYFYKQQQPPPLLTTVVYPQPKLLPDFELIDQHNQPFTNQQLQGKWSVLFFGYTYCPDICPTTMAALAQVVENLPAEIQQQLQVIFVSVDPERDPPKRLAEYVPFFHPDFIAVTGKDEPLLAFSMSLGGVYLKIPAAIGYSITHSNTIFIIDPEAHRFGVFSRSAMGALDVSAMTQDLETIITSH